MAHDNVSVVGFISRDDNGTVDKAASMAKFETALTAFILRQESDDELISTCLATVFASKPGAKMNQDYIASQTVEEMARRNPELADPKMYAPLKKRVVQVLGQEIDRGKYESKKGPGGGTWSPVSQSAISSDPQ